MSATSIIITYLVAGQDFAFTLRLGGKRSINHIFRAAGETFDVSGLVSLEELNSSAEFVRLVEAGIMSVATTIGSTDFQASLYGTATLSSATPAALGGAAAAGSSGSGSKSDHVHAISAGGIATAALADASITPAKVAVKDASGIGVMQILRVALTAGGASGTADDVTIFAANAPYKFRVVDAWANIATAVAGSMNLRTATGGGGTQLSGAIDTTAAGIARAAGTALTATSTVPAGGTLAVRRTDRSMTGELFVALIRET